ncbi:MAG: DUF1573 domain-containing protein [Patescibacteria group bacterium]
MNKNNIISGVIIAVLLLGGVVWVTLSSGDSRTNKTPVASSSKGKLTLPEANYDFGTISMAKGNVSHIFKVKNEGPETVNLSRLYTSCMCTTATLKVKGSQDGPFGMQGHGFVPLISRDLKSGEEAEVEAIFDPTAHGPAGVGKIERVIMLENNTSDNPISINFSANVTP